MLDMIFHTGAFLFIPIFVFDVTAGSAAIQDYSVGSSYQNITRGPSFEGLSFDGDSVNGLSFQSRETIGDFHNLEVQDYSSGSFTDSSFTDGSLSNGLLTDKVDLQVGIGSSQYSSTATRNSKAKSKYAKSGSANSNSSNKNKYERTWLNTLIDTFFMLFLFLAFFCFKFFADYRERRIRESDYF